MRSKNGEAKKQARKEMKKLFGFVPDFHEAMPEAARASSWGIQRDLELSETSLDNKTKELIGLAVAAHIKCRYCIHFHTEAARAFGAKEDELREAVAMGGMTVLFSNTITGMQLDMDEFRNQVDRALEHMKSQSKTRTESARA
jgi:AhpD family alkylhydroperoxidase